MPSFMDGILFYDGAAFHTELQLGSIWKPEIWEAARDFPADEAIFLQEYSAYCKKNGAQQAEKIRCLGVLTVFR